jgi:hypothetical protein
MFGGALAETDGKARRQQRRDAQCESHIGRTSSNERWPLPKWDCATGPVLPFEKGAGFNSHPAKCA